MFGWKRREKVRGGRDTQGAMKRFERNERAGKEIYAGIADLKNIPRDKLPDAVFMLFVEAKRQNERIRTSLQESTGHDFNFDRTTDGDLATYLAEGAAHALRDHVADSQTLFEAISEQSPKVNFTLTLQDAVSLVSALIREQRLEGILEGLRLAGLLNEAPNRRPVSPEADGLR